LASVSLEHVSKTYPNGANAVSDLNLEIADGEFMVLVGPSGCGKTTALRMVAGLEEITEGTIRFNDRVVNDLSPRERDIAMVFQNYALYPHMTVAENIGFSLTLAKLPKAEINAKVSQAAEILGLTEHLGRKPGQLSGGQRQRVAMGRAIVREPSVFLMDEPLSNLDAKLRVQMRTEVARIQHRLNVATIYVTHDQTEAMTMGDRVAVLRTGALQQCDAPQALYDSPTNLFVAAFIGSPAMNLYEGTISAEGNEVHLGEQGIELPSGANIDRSALEAYRGKEVVFGIRPEDLHDAAAGGAIPSGRRLEGDVDVVEALGAERLVHFHLDAGRVQAPGALEDSDSDAGTGDLAAGELGAAAMNAGVARVEPTSMIRPGERAVFVVDTDRIHLFDPTTGHAIGR
jgi:multiple sugar transport system ATP-binding protein